MIGEFELDTGSFLPLHIVVYEALRKAILKEDLKPGERLMENTIAGKMGVSRTPVREAIRMLSDEGLVLIIPRRGAQVAQISLTELNDVLEIRRTLEALAISSACDRITEEGLASLSAAEDAFKEAVRSGNITKIAEADVAFHDVIYEASGNRRLPGLLSNLREQMYRFRFEYLKKPGVYEVLIREHDAIAEAVGARDKERAETLIKNHIENQQISVGSGLGQQGAEHDG